MRETNTNPLVTIITLCHYTKAKFVIDAVESVFAQTYSNIEHIIVNDAPNDTTEWPQIKKHIIQKEYRSKIVENSNNLGINRNLNQIITNTNGHFIAACSDDLWEPNFLKKQVEFLLNQEEKVAATFSDLIIIDENDKKIGEIVHKADFDVNNATYENQLIELLKRNFIPAPSVVFKKEAVLSVDKYFEDIYAEDYQMWFKLLLNGYKILYNNICEAKYRIRSGAVSNNYETSGKMALDRCRLFHQTKTITSHNLWQEVEPIYYKFVKKVIAHPNLSHTVKEEVAQNAIKDLSYSTTYLLRLISLLHLYKLPFINNKIR